MGIKLLKEYLRLVIEAKVIDEDDDEEKKKTKDEASVTSAVAGYTGPLGATATVPKAKSKRRKPWQAAGSAFGGAKPVK